MNDPYLPGSQAGKSAPAVQATPQAETQTSSPALKHTILRALLLGAAAGMLIPLAAIIYKSVGCHYGLRQLGDILSAVGFCGLPPLIVGACITTAGASIGSAAGRRADKRRGSSQRANRGAWIETGVGMFLSLIVSVVPSLALMFPDC